MTRTWQPPSGFVQVSSLVDGILVFAPAPETAEAARETFQCPQCGATVAYNVAAGGVACEYCGYVAESGAAVVGRAADEFEFKVETLEQASRGWGAERRELHCEACGADITLPEGELSVACPFCASNRVVTRAAPQDVLRPRFLIPFKIEPDSCAKLAQGWLGEGWLHPGQLAQSASLARFTGIYLPFWTFDARIGAHWEAEVGYERTESYWEDGELKTRTVIDWRWESGRVTVNVDDHLTSGTSKVSNVLLGRLNPYDLNQLTAYDAGYMAGWQAQAYDVSLEPAWDKARAHMRLMAKEACHKDIPSSHVRNFSMSADFSDETWRYILLPVYVAAYRFEQQTYQVMVNGQTGAVAGQKPVAWWKVWAAIAALLLPGGLCGLIGLVGLAFGGVGVVGLVLGAVLLVIGVVISVSIFRKAQAADDV